MRAVKKGKAAGPDKIYAESLKLLVQREDTVWSSRKHFLTPYIESEKYRQTDSPQSLLLCLRKRWQQTVITIDWSVLYIMFRKSSFVSYIRGFTGSANKSIQLSSVSGMACERAKRVSRSMYVLSQRCRDMNIYVYTCFIDYRTVDCVSRHRMAEILRANRIDAEDLRIITELYWHQIG